MLPDLLDDLMRAWDHRAPVEPAAAPSVTHVAVVDQPTVSAAPPATAAIPTWKFVAVSLGRKRFAFPVESVVEAARYPRTTLVPGLPEHVCGVFSFRGEILPVIDACALLEGGALPNPTESRILTLQSADGLTRAAFAFEALEGIVNLDTDDEAASPATGLIRKTGRHEGDPFTYAIVDTAELLRTAGCLDDAEAA